MSAIKIDQAGLSAGVAGVSRTDGLANGELVLLENVAPSGFTQFRLLWVPPDDDSAVATLAPAPGNPDIWTFTPTAESYGTYLVELLEDGLRIDVRVFGIRTPGKRLLIPALNELASKLASLENDGPDQIALSQNNAIDFPEPALNALAYAGWWRAMHELYRIVEMCLTAPVPLTALATQPEGTVLLRELGAGSGVPTAGSGAQVGAITRLAGFTGGVVAAGTYNDYPIADGTKVVDVDPNGGDVIFTGFLVGTSNAGAFFALGKFGSADRVVLKHGSSGSLLGNRLSCPGGVDYVLSSDRDTCWIVQFNNRLQVVARGADGFSEIEAAGPGPHNDFDPLGAMHVMGTDPAGVITGVVSAGIVGKLLVVSHQGTGYTEFQHNTGSATANRFFNGRLGKHLRLFDNEMAVYRLVDTAAGATVVLRWQLISPNFPFAHASDNAIGDTFSHDGTNWTAGIASFLRLVERAAGITLSAGQALLFPKTDHNLYFRDQTNTDRKIVTAPALLTDIAPLAQGSMLGRAILGGSGVPIELTGVQQGQNLRRATSIQDTLSTGTIASYPLAEDTCQVIFSGVAVRTIDIHGATFIQGKPIEWCVDSGSGAVVRFFNESATAPTNGEKLRTPNGQTITLRAGEQLSTVLQSNRHRMSAVAKRIDPELLAIADANGEGLTFQKRIAFSATGATGTIIDVDLWGGARPPTAFALRITKAELRVSTAIPLTAAALRTGAAGGGTVVLPDNLIATQTFSTATVGPKADAAVATATLAAAASLFLNVDRAIAGEVILTCMRT